MSLEKFYEPIIARKETDNDWHKANGWGSQRSQVRRFAVATEVLGVKTGDTVLDWGCGTGELSKYLHNHGIDVGYLGVDIVPDMVHLALSQGIDAINRDLYVEPFNPNTFDHVFCIGTVGALEGGSEAGLESLRKLIDTADSIARQGFVFTLLTDRDGEKENDGYHWYTHFNSVVGEVMDMIGHEKPVIIRSDYHPHDVMFCVLNKIF